jgi:hypothetical protein
VRGGIMRYLLLALLLIASPAHADIDTWMGQTLAVAGGGAPSFCGGSELVCDDFEGNDTCANLGWTVGGSPDCQATDYKDGSYSAKFVHGGTQPDVYQAFTAQTTVFVKLDVRASAVDATNYISKVHKDGSEGPRFGILFNGKFRIQHGTVTSDSSNISADTWYTVKAKIVTGTGANGEMYLWYTAGQNQSLSTNTGDADLSITNGTDTDANWNRAYFINDENGDTLWFDNIKVMATDPDA